MKHLINILLALLSISSINAQSINPLESTVVCPSTEYTFSVTLPAAYSSLNSPGITITQPPYNFNTSNTTFNFKAKFGDVNQTQVFTVAYSGGSKDFRFAKVKSLFYGHCGILTPNQFSINAPLCLAKDFTINFTNVKWQNSFENPVLCFSDITDYQYLLPAGWKIGAKVSNGTAWINAGNPATVTSDLSTGDGQTIQVRAYNSCNNGSSNYFGSTAYIPVTRSSGFALAASPISIVCGATTPVTFTVTNPNNIPGITGYVWNLGAGNGWQYNGTAAPATIATTGNTLLLTPVCGSSLSTIFVSVTAGANSCNSNTSIVSITQPAMSINGNSSICTGPANYSIAGLPCNATVTWSALPTGIVTPNTSTSLNPSFTKVADGLITLTATILNSCASQPTIRLKDVIVGMPNASLTGSYNYTGGGSIPITNFGNPVLLFGKNNAAYAINIGMNSLLTGTNSYAWSVVSGNGYNNVSFNGSAAYFNLQGTGAPTISLNLTGTNSICGSITRNIVVIANQAGSSSISVFPNPATGNFNLAFTEAGDRASSQKSGEKVITAIRSLNSTGKTIISLFEFNSGYLARQWTKNEINNKKYNFNLAGLKKGLYVLQVDRDNQATTTQVIIE